MHHLPYAHMFYLTPSTIIIVYNNYIHSKYKITEHCIHTLFAVRSPEVIITEPSSPMFGAPFRPNCTASLPQEVQDGNLTVSWIGPDGSVLASVSTMDQSASVDLPITTLETSDFGTYICRAVVTSPFLDRSVVSSGTLNLGGSIQTPPPVTNPPPSQPSEPSGPVPSTQPSQPPPPATDPSTASQSPATPQSTTQRVTTMRPATSKNKLNIS